MVAVAAAGSSAIWCILGAMPASFLLIAHLIHIAGQRPRAPEPGDLRAIRPTG
jgi:hypothetical protein